MKVVSQAFSASMPVIPSRRINAGFVLWGDSEALDELHQLIHFLVDESPLIEGKDGFMLSLAYDIRKAREGCRRTEQYEYESQDTYNIYGVELLWPLILIQLALFRRSKLHPSE
nr:hypothetical protein [Klebsiella variicola]